MPVVLVLIGRGEPAWPFLLLVLALAAVAQWELYRMFARIGIAADVGAGLVLGALVVLAFAFGGGTRPWLVSLALSVAVAACLALGLRGTSGARPDWGGRALTLLGVCYCAWLLGHAVWLRALPDGAALTRLALGVTWCGEAAAFFVGRRFGRHKLAPQVSPGKTVEGAGAQLVLSVLAALVPWGVGSMTAAHAVGIGLVLGITGQIGDLAESFLKRSAAAKDAGVLVPGHGGLLDRLDSLLFNLPALYYYVTLLPLQGRA